MWRIGARRATISVLRGGGLYFNGTLLATRANPVYAGALALSGVNTFTVLPLGDATQYTLSGALTGAGSLVNNGANLLLTSTANTYSGATTVNAGSIQFGNATVAASGVNTLTGTGAMSIAAGASVSMFAYHADGTGLNFQPVVSGAGTINFIGDGTSNRYYYNLTSNSPSFTGQINLINSRLINNNTANQYGSATINVTSGAQLYLNQNLNNPLILAGTGWQAPPASLGALRFGGAFTYSGPITLAADAQISAYLAGTGTISGAIGGNKNLQIFGGGTDIVVFTGANTYTGYTQITNINTANSNTTTLQIGAGGTAGTLGAGAIYVGGAATLKFNRSDAITLTSNQTISDATTVGGVTINGGAGTVAVATGNVSFNTVATTLTATVASGATYTATTNTNPPISIAGTGLSNAGALVLGAGGVTYASAITLTAAASISASSYGYISVNISGAYAVTFASGNILISGALTLPSCVIANGARIADNNATSAAPTAVQSGGILYTTGTGSCGTLTMQAVGSVYQVSPLSASSVSLFTCSSFALTASAWTVNWNTGFTLAAGTYPIIKVTSTTAPTLGTVTTTGLSNVGRTGATYTVTGSAGNWSINAVLT